jgi:hypothetical protein
MELPMDELSTMAVGSMSDDDLFRAERDLTTVATHLTVIAAKCMQRAKAVTSTIMKREHARSQGREVAPATPGEGKGGRDLVRAPGEKVSFSDHAVLRWLERTADVDLDAVRAEMTAAYDAGGTMAGGGIVVSGDNCFVRTAQGLVKTMIPLSWLRDEDVEVARVTYERGIGKT